MLITWTVVIVSQVYACIKIHQIVYIKDAQFSMYQLYFEKAVKIFFYNFWYDKCVVNPVDMITNYTWLDIDIFFLHLCQLSKILGITGILGITEQNTDWNRLM